MASKLYVGNLPFSASEDEIRDFFSPVGDVQSVKIITDRDTGRSRGFCFVEMDNADSAITDLNGKELSGRKLTVSEARERERRSNDGHRGSGARRGFNSR